MAVLFPVVYHDQLVAPPARIFPCYPVYPAPHLPVPVHIPYGCRPCLPIPAPWPLPLPCHQTVSFVPPSAPVKSQEDAPVPVVARIQIQVEKTSSTKKNHVNKPCKLIEVSWRFPEKGCLKLNTDGSSKGNPGRSSFGGLIRDDKGKWVCGFLGKMSGNQTSLYAEIAGMARGLALIQCKKLMNVIVETDCKAVVQLMNSVESMDTKNPLKRILLVCKKILVDLNCSLVHTLREGNFCADQLAQLGGEQSKGLEILENPPDSLLPFLLADESGMTYARKVSASHA